MEYTREEKFLIWLDSFLSLDYARKAKIAALSEGGGADLSRMQRIAGEENFAEMKRRYSARYIEKILGEYEKKGISCVTHASSRYPELLKQTSQPPLVLYCKGNARLLSDWRKFAVVGSRRTPANILKLTEEFSKRLAEAFTIVTGLADGGDSAAIRGAL